MSTLRISGLFTAVALLLALLVLRRRRDLQRGEFLLGALFALALGAVALDPGLVSGLSAAFQAPTRLLTLAIVSNFALFVLFLYAIVQVSKQRRSLSDLVRSLAREEYGRQSADDTFAEISLIIPAYDEERNLADLLPRIPATVVGLKVKPLVVVDGLKDRSVEVARGLAVPATFHAINRGGGEALRTGYDLSLAARSEIVVTMDADGQHRPEELERLILPIHNGQADVVIGNRFLGDYQERGSVRHAGVILFSWIVSVLAGVRIGDCTNGYRAIRASALRRLNLREQQFHTAEFIMESAHAGLRIREVPVTVQRRLSGESKKPPGLGYPLRFAWTVFKVWLRS